MANPLANDSTWIYHLGDVSAKRAAQIGAAEADLLVIEQSDFSGAKPRDYTASDLDTMRGEAGKTVVSYISIGEAETYRAYWDADWRRSPPAWLDEPNPNWDGNIKVRYWDPDWQGIVFDMVDRMVDQGFDGLYLDIVDAYEYFEETAPRAGVDYRAEMVSFVSAIRAHAEARLAETGADRDFAIIPQNGAELILEKGYLKVIDGIGQEDLRFVYDDPDRERDFAPQSNGDFRYTLDLLARAEAAGVETFVVEYMTAARQAQFADVLAAEIRALEKRGIGFYVGEDRDLDRLYDQSAVADPGDGPTPTSGLRLVGTGRADELYGGRQDDVLHGRRGDDVLAGDGGDDVLRGNRGHDELFGERGRDNLIGGRGHDYIEGGAGRDRLDGGRGDDELFGGAGADIFVFGPRFGHDLIGDFDVSEDVLILTRTKIFDTVETADGIALEFRDGSGIELADLDMDDMARLHLVNGPQDDLA